MLNLLILSKLVNQECLFLFLRKGWWFRELTTVCSQLALFVACVLSGDEHRNIWETLRSLNPLGIYLLLQTLQVGSIHGAICLPCVRWSWFGLELQSTVTLLRGRSVRELGRVPACSFWEHVIFNKEKRCREDTFSVACCLRLLIFNAGYDRKPPLLSLISLESSCQLSQWKTESDFCQWMHSV